MCGRQHCDRVGRGGLCFGGKFEGNCVRAAAEACRATCSLQPLWDRGKSRKSIDRVGRSQDLPAAHWPLACSPVFRYTNGNGICTEQGIMNNEKVLPMNLQ